MRCDAGYKTQGNLQKPSNAMRRQPGASSTDSTNSKPLPGHGALFKGPDQFGCSHNASVWGTVLGPPLHRVGIQYESFPLAKSLCTVFSVRN